MHEATATPVILQAAFSSPEELWRLSEAYPHPKSPLNYPADNGLGGNKLLQV